MVGKISYDVSKDEFSMNEPIALIGGGIQETIEFLQKRYLHFADVAGALAFFGVALLSITAFSMYCRHMQKKNLERIERLTLALAAREP